MLREQLIRVAYLNPEIRPHAIHLLTAKEFSNPGTLKEYLREHPHADKSNHWVSKSDPKAKPKDEGGFFSGVKAFLEEHLGHAKHVHTVVKQAPAHVQKFIADPKHREVIVAKGVDEAKKAPKKLLDKAIFLVKDEFNEKKVGLQTARKVLGKEITKEEKAALIESVRDISVSVMLSVFAGGGLVAVGSGLLSGLAMGVAIRMFSDTVDKLTDVKDTAIVGGKIVRYGLPVLKKLVHLGSDASEEDVQEAIATMVVSEVLNRLSKGISNEDVTYALEHFKAE